MFDGGLQKGRVLTHETWTFMLFWDPSRDSLGLPGPPWELPGAPWDSLGLLASSWDSLGVPASLILRVV